MDEVKKRICSKENKISNLKLSPIKINYISLMEYVDILYFKFYVRSSNVHWISSMDLIYWLQSHGNELDKLDSKYIMRMTCINFYTF